MQTSVEPDVENHDEPVTAKRPWLARFLWPRFTQFFVFRLCLVAALAYGFFGHICVPARIQGRSMEPTYHSGGFTFCWRPRYWIHAPRRGDIVMVRLAGLKVMYLKRVIALAGDTVAFRGGQLVLNGKPVNEPYVAGPCTWELDTRTVPPEHVYVVGDNRSMSIEEHQFGSVLAQRIEGGPM